MIMVGYVHKVAEYGTDFFFSHDAKNMYHSLNNKLLVYAGV